MRTCWYQPGLIFGRRFYPRAGRFTQVLPNIAAPACLLLSPRGSEGLAPSAWLAAQHKRFGHTK